MEIIPVMDVMKGVVVHAVAGKREEYKPLGFSAVSPSPRPEDVLKGFKKLGCKRVYIADLDAIMGKGDNSYVIEIAVKQMFNVLADVGLKGLMNKDSENILYVIGTEYLVYPDDLNLVGGRVVSLDMKGGKVLFKNASIDLVEAAGNICSRNVKMVIVLNLDRVGTGAGLDLDAIKIVKKLCNVDLAVGGGLKDLEEIPILKSLGVKYLLVASAIHKGVVDKCIY